MSLRRLRRLRFSLRSALRRRKLGSLFGCGGRNSHFYVRIYTLVIRQRPSVAVSYSVTSFIAVCAASVQCAAAPLRALMQSHFDTLNVPSAPLRLEATFTVSMHDLSEILLSNACLAAVQLPSRYVLQCSSGGSALTLRRCHLQPEGDQCSQRQAELP